MAKLKLDLHDTYDKERDIGRSLNEVMEEAVGKRIPSWKSSRAKAADN